MIASAMWGLLQITPLAAQGPMGPGGPGGQTPMRVDPSVKATFVPLGMGVPGVLYEPVAPGEKSRIGLFVMHAGADYLTFSACTELSKRGYRVLCANNSGGSLDHILLDAKRGVAYLRALAGVKKVVLWGHSGGATVMTAYQVVAENGVKVCQAAEKIAKCSDSLAGLPAADGLVLADSNWGNAEMTLFSIDPAVVRDDSGMDVKPELDLFNPTNGFNPQGSTYSAEFIARFQRMQGRRNNELIQTALVRLGAIQAGKGRFLDDEPFTAAGAGSMGGNNKLFAQDVRLMSHTRKPWPLIHADGSVTTEIVRTVRPPQNSRSLTPMLGMGAVTTTVRTYLTNSAIRVMDDYGYGEDSVQGVVWRSSYSSPPGNVEDIHVPLLALGMTGNWEYLAAETIYEHAASADKSLGFVEGANHMYLPCRPCEKTPGQYGDTVKTLYDYVDRWLSAKGRF